MAPRFAANINHQTITDCCTNKTSGVVFTSIVIKQLQIAVQISQLVNCGLCGIYLDCHLFLVMINKTRHNHKHRQFNKIGDFCRNTKFVFAQCSTAQVLSSESRAISDIGVNSEVKSHVRNQHGKIERLRHAERDHHQ